MLPRVIVIGTYVTLVTSAVASAVVLVEKYKNNETCKETTAKVPYIMGFGLIIAVVLWYIIDTNKNMNKFAKNAAENYIKSALVSHKELGDFNEILSNPRAMQYIATFIANNLRESEQKQIVSIISKTEQAVAPLNMDQAYQQINKIIEEHILLHPEFIPSLYSEMAYANHNYIVKNRHKSR